MKALITGASSGLGLEMAKILADKGYDLILVARRQDRLLKIAKEIKTDAEVVPLDVSDTQNLISLYEKVKNEDVEVVINNAGFGIFGHFDETDLMGELDMIDVNVKAVHTLTKLFLREFVKRNRGYILNTCSIAGFMAGPQMATYYASKNYTLKLTTAINEELRHERSGVYVGALCPGPVRTEFFDVANVHFVVGGMTAEQVAKYAVNKMFKRKRVIIPGFFNKLLVFLSKITPLGLLLKGTYYAQCAKK